MQLLRTDKETSWTIKPSTAGRIVPASISTRIALRDKSEQLGKMGDAISAEVSRGRALGYYIERRESGAAGAFTAKTREEADKQLEETIAQIAAKQAIEKAGQNS
jgi:hypothetical protein